jgi:branched-chain amino acid transport system substrate-binding protein
MGLLASRWRSKQAAIRLLAVTVVVAFGLAVTAASGGAMTSKAGSAKVLGPTQRATGSPVLIGFISDGLSANIDATPEIPAAQAAVNYINSHLRGIGGHVLRLDTCLDGETPSGTTNCVNQMIAAHVDAVLYNVTGQGATIATGLRPAHIPLFAFGAIDQGTLLSKAAFVLTNGLGALAGPPALLQQSGGKRAAVIEIDVPEAIGPVQQLGGAFYKNAGATMTAVPIPPGTADMTPQIQATLNKNPDQVSIIGNDTFCISAIEALRTLGYTKQIVIDASCVTGAAKKALGSRLKGVVELTASSTDPATHEVALFNAVMAAYAHGTSLTTTSAQGGYAVVLGFARAMTGISGAITPDTVLNTAVAMKPQPLPLAKGLTFQCTQKQVSFAAAICSTGYLATTLDSRGNPTKYKPIDLSALLKL